MQRTLVILAAALFFDPLATSAANPPNSPDIVFIDGQPCNRLCQSYMAWSRKVTPVTRQFERVSTRAAAGSARAKISGKRLAADAATASGAAEATIKDSRPASNAADVPDTPNAKGGDSRRTVGVATDFATRMTRKQVMAATAVAERVTAAAAVAIVIARPEIKSVSDLARKTIAIDDNHSALTGDVRTAIAAAGAAEIKLAESRTGAIDRVIGGELPAAVLTLVSREAAEGFPEVTGFNVFRIPLTPEMPQAKIADQRPADAVVSGSQERTTQELVAAAAALAERMTVATAASQGAALASSNNIDARVAILIARPEIKSVSDLTGKAIAIDDRLLDSSRDIEIAMTAAGATEVRVNEPEGKPSEPVIDGAVPAAVLTLVSREAANAFPEISGFKIFRIPLTPETPQAKVMDLQPAQASAAELDPRATKPAEAKQTAVAVAGDGPRANSGNSSGDAARLMTRASALLAQGNISAARAVLERAADAGSARASFTLAETYDPLILPKLKAYGTRGDATKARELYARAEAGGVKEAKARFEALASSTH
jgi:hypothetical protein